MSEGEEAIFLKLFKGGLVPLYVILPSLTWVLHDYLVTVEDEVLFIWPKRRHFGKYMFLWIRYYTIILLLFDALQIHTFARAGRISDTVCIAMDPITRLAGAVSLWSVEVVMQLRVYALFKCSKRVAIFNAILFSVSIGAFLWILILNTMARRAKIAFALRLPLPGCPAINAGNQWALWVPATAYEFILFGFASYQALKPATRGVKLSRASLRSILINDNILYFFGIACLLVFNNLMVVGTTRIPWFSFGPFHASIGILTTRMLIHLHKATANEVTLTSNLGRLSWARSPTESGTITEAAYMPSRMRAIGPVP